MNESSESVTPIEPDRFEPTRRSVAAWVLYDLANTVFALGVGSRYFAPWVVEHMGRPDWYLSAATIVAMLAVIVIGPWLGALTDHVGRRRPYLVAATLVTVGATALLTTGAVWLSLVLYAVGSAAFHLGTIVYDAMLPDVSTPERRGLVSGLGVSVGYVGSLLALGIGAYLLPRAGYAAVFKGLAIAFLVLAVPAFVWIKERPRQPMPGRPPSILRSPKIVIDAWREAAHHKGVVRFLVGRFLYTDAINTVFLFNAVFVKMELGFSDEKTNVLAVAAIVAAGLGAALAGRVVDRLGPRRVLHTALYALTVGVIAAVAASLFDIPELGWLIGILGGAGVGAVWTSDRVYMTRLSPPELLGEFFGLYATAGRFATVLGPLAWSLIADGLGLGRGAALASLAVFVLLARAVLEGVSDRVAPTARPAS